MSGPVFSFPGLSLEQTKNNPLFCGVQELGDDSRQMILFSKDEFLALVLLGFILITRLHNGVRLKFRMDHMEYSSIPVLSLSF
jgi:hypothetical protein